MGRPITKADMLEAANENYEKLCSFMDSMTKQELETPFDFEQDIKKTEAHWKRDKNLRDVLIHLYEWHNLLLNWVEANQKGEKASFIPKPYSWSNYGELNQEFWKKHQNTTLEAAKQMLAKSHEDVYRLGETFSDEELFSKGVFDWVGGSTLGSYFVSNLSSHYNWALKKLRAHRRKLK